MSSKRKYSRQGLKKKRYPSDLSRTQWKEIRRFFWVDRKLGRPNKYPLKEVLNAILYVLRTGCQWRQLPQDLPHWQSAFYHFRKWQRLGCIDRVHTFLRNKIRKREGKEMSPSLGAIDSQSLKASEQTAEVGYDAVKKVKGVKIHTVVDTLGMLLKMCVLPANVQDREGAKLLLDGLKKLYPRLEKVNADCGYRGQLKLWIEDTQGFKLEIVEKKEKGFHLLP